MTNNIQECIRNRSERLRCENFQLYFSADAGESWLKLPNKRTTWTRIAQAGAQWPFIPRAFGWYEGRIAVVHDDFHEDGSPNFRFLSSFDNISQKWTSRSYGPVVDYSDQWWRQLDFEIVTEIR